MGTLLNFARTVRALPFLEVTAADEGHLEARIVFAPRAATLTWSAVGNNGAVNVVLEGDLPSSALAEGEEKSAKRVRALLKPQRGVAANIEALKEIKLQDENIDTAFVIHGDDPGLLLAIVPELKELAAFPPDIVIDDDIIKITWSALADEHAERAVAGAFALWHRAVFFLISP